MRSPPTTKPAEAVILRWRYPDPGLTSRRLPDSPMPIHSAKPARRSQTQMLPWLGLVVLMALLPVAPAAVSISELVASNATGLRDEDGDTSDWIELFNDGTTPVDLAGWSLTDDSANPGQWVLPAVTIQPQGFVLVFASAKNRALPGAALHANFKLAADGGYLGLFQPGGALAHHYQPYPAQYEDKPYGIQQTVVTTQLVAGNAALRYRVPTSADPSNASWTALNYNDGGWATGTNGVGFESTVPQWLFKTYFSNQSIPNLTQAAAVISTPSLQTGMQQVNHPVVNFDNTSSAGHYTPENSPAFLTGADLERYVVEATGILTIPAAGAWTFCVASDDGCSLQIRPLGGSYTTVLSYTDLRGMNDSLGTYSFPTAGQYEIRVIVFENGGGSGGEVCARQGSYASWSSNFKLIGDTAAGGLAISSSPVGAGSSGYLAHVGTDVKAPMFDASPKKSSCYLRYAFTNPGGLTSLTMPIRYDDGLVAYLNGTEVARRNAPAGTPTNTTTAAGDRPATLATTPELIDLTPFLDQLTDGAGNVLAIHGLTEAATDGDFLIKAELAQYAVTAGSVNYYQAATPGGFNTAGIYNRVAPVVASAGRGLYTSAQTVILSTGTAGATIRYTFDGATPTLTSATSATYTKPLTINKTTTLRFAAFKTGFDASEVVTQTYIFPTDVLAQSPAGAAPSITNPPGATQPATTWPTGPINGQVLDYGMDPDVVNNPAWSATLTDDLKAIPSFSIVTEVANLFDAGTGIYVNPGGDQLQWERPCSLELIHPDGSTGFQVNCGIRLRGGFSRSGDNPKHAFRFFFRDAYGPAKLNYSLFGDTPGAAAVFDKFDLRSAQNYSWAFQGDGGNGIFIRDTVARDMQLATGNVSSHGGFYHLYLNGQYWGLFNIDERPEASFGATYFGGAADDYDAIKIDPDLGYNVEATDGNTDAWYQLWQLADTTLAAGNTAPANDAAYQRLLGNNADGTPNAAFPVLIDPVGLIDEMLIVYWGGNLDAPVSAFLGNTAPNNWFGVRDRTGAHGGFRFILHDSEHTMLNVNEDRTGPWPAGSTAQQGGEAFGRSNPQYLFQQCLYSPAFKALFADRVYRHMANNGVLTPTGATAIFDARKAEIDRAVVAESARWGDSKTNPPLTRDHWLAAINNVRGNFLPGRTNVVIGQLRTRGWYPAFDPPVLGPRGGLLAPGTSVTVIAGSGTPGGRIIYFTSDGSDPRLAGGGLNPAAQTIPSGGSLAINSSKVLRARTRSGTTWSALEDVSFYVTQDYSALALTEINYNPPDSGAVSGDNFEFLELKNTGTSPLDLGGLAFTEGITYTFAPGTRLESGAFFVLARNATGFLNRYGFSPHGVFASGGLNNSGEKIGLTHALGGSVLAATYNDTAPWPAAADGSGFTAVPRTTTYNSDDGSYWRASAALHGSPGTDDPPSNIPSLVVNEVLTNSTLPMLDSIELYNPTDAAVDIGGWWLTDDPSKPQKYRIPAGTQIAAGGFATFDETHFNTTPGVAPSFALSAAGDDVYLFSGTAAGGLTGYSHGVEFGGAENGVSFGRYVNSIGEEQFPRQGELSFGAANAGPLVGPLVINEVMYHPYPGYDEYIEIRNLSAEAIALYDPANPANTWKVGGLNYFLPAASAIPAGALALVVGSDPATFRTKYAVPAQVQIFGPAGGVLQDSGERISLEMPGLPVLSNGLPLVPYAIIDTVRYNDKLPWPLAADGGGPALQRLDASAYADDPVNWFANGATPGRGNSINQLPVITLTAPATNSNYTLPATIQFQASASDPDGSIIKVEYYIDGSKVGEAATAPFIYDWPATGGIHSATAKVIDNGFGLGTSEPVVLYVTTPVGQGLRADYYANSSLSVPVAFTRTDATVNFDDYSGTWVNFGGVSGDQFSVRWTGQVRAPATGSFTFFAAADDGVRLTVNGQQLVNAWVDQGETEYSGTLPLVAGQLYPVVMEMYENWGGAAARLRWSGPGVAKEIIPQSFLYPDSAPIIVTHPVGLSRELGASATFSVFASGLGNTYQWRKNGVVIPAATGPIFTLDNLWTSDAGDYSVSVSNSGGFLFSNPAPLVVTVTDADGDGMQDAWEIAHGLNPGSLADAQLDADGDGSSNQAEFLAGTDPHDPASVFRLAVTPTADNRHLLRFTAYPNKSYSLQFAADLTTGSWQSLPGGQVEAQRGGSPRLIEITDPTPAGSRRFYRAVTPQQP